MKHIKTYEDLSTECKIGDHALFDYTNKTYAYHAQLTNQLRDFLNTNIGLLVTVSSPNNDWLEVFYDDIPTNLQYKFHIGTILLNIENIVELGKTRKEVEQKIEAKKYNL
jgi:hypothetical protein